MNKKGQALVEFVLIMPIVIMIFSSIVDISRIIIRKNELENITTDVIEMYKNNKSEEEINYYIRQNINNSMVKITKENNETTFNLSSKIDLITPGFNLVLDNPYNVENKRVIIYE